MRAKRLVRLATGRTAARLDGAAQPGTAMTGVTGLGAVVDCRAAADRAATAYPALIRRVVAIAAIGTIVGIAVPALVAAPDRRAALDAANRLAGGFRTSHGVTLMRCPTISVGWRGSRFRRFCQIARKCNTSDWRASVRSRPAVRHPPAGGVRGAGETGLSRRKSSRTWCCACVLLMPKG